MWKILHYLAKFSRRVIKLRDELKWAVKSENASAQVFIGTYKTGHGHCASQTKRVTKFVTASPETRSISNQCRINLCQDLSRSPGRFKSWWAQILAFRAQRQLEEFWLQGRWREECNVDGNHSSSLGQSDVPVSGGCALHRNHIPFDVRPISLAPFYATQIN